MRQERRSKILIVDDNPQNIELLMELFKDEYKIAAATNAQRALKIAASHTPPDIILADILMPEMDGYDLCLALKKDTKTQNIPVIFVTALSEILDENRGFSLGAIDYITKPFHPPVVKARVRLHLDLKRKQELLEKYAFIDALTEIPNRRRFDEVMDCEWNRAMRSGNVLSLIFMDIDYFKTYNDTYGHDIGDECLRRVAACLQNSMRRAGDFVARYGGEEFAAILPYTNYTDAIAMAKHITKNVDDLAIEHKTSDACRHLSLSMGITTIRPSETSRPSDFLKTADTMLYSAKEKGRHSIQGIDQSVASS